MTDTSPKAPRINGAKTRFGLGAHKLCGARANSTRQPCRCPAMKNGRCRLHGGKSTGPRTKEGRDRQRLSVTKHGLASGPGNPLNRELYGTDAPGPRWQGNAGSRAVKRAMKNLTATLEELDKLDNGRT